MIKKDIESTLIVDASRKIIQAAWILDRKIGEDKKFFSMEYSDLVTCLFEKVGESRINETMRVLYLSGPGSFSSLRAASILTISLEKLFNCQIYAISHLEILANLSKANSEELIVSIAIINREYVCSKFYRKIDNYIQEVSPPLEYTRFKERQFEFFKLIKTIYNSIDPRITCEIINLSDNPDCLKTEIESLPCTKNFHINNKIHWFNTIYNEIIEKNTFKDYKRDYEPLYELNDYERLLF